jgi:uncharacterized protein (UPF0332 family)
MLAETTYLMLSENVQKLAHFRLSQADDAVRAASLLLDQGFLRDAVNRSYYGMFYAVLALLVTKIRYLKTPGSHDVI